MTLARILVVSLGGTITMTQFSMPGASLSVQNLAAVAQLLREKFALGIDDAVVVQGTDTIEDTAFVLDMLANHGKPVVVTGAMRGPQAAGADGPANLLAAVSVAAEPRGSSLLGTGGTRLAFAGAVRARLNRRRH